MVNLCKINILKHKIEQNGCGRQIQVCLGDENVGPAAILACKSLRRSS
jgi:hypothetical protein